MIYLAISPIIDGAQPVSHEKRKFEVYGRRRNLSNRQSGGLIITLA